MQKTKFGVSVGVLGALLYFCGLFGGYLITTLLAAYVLIYEENAWLKKAAVKAIALMVCFSVLYSVVGLIPQAIEIINSAVNVFGGYFSIGFISKIAHLALSVITFCETVIFIILGFKAFSQGTVNVPLIDSFINKQIN